MRKVIRLGIGDVTEPLAPAITDAMHAAVDEMARRETFRGLRPGAGLRFSRRRDPHSRLHRARRRHRRRRDLRQRRQQVRQRQRAGDLRARREGRGHRSGLPGLRRFERDGRSHAGRWRRRPLSRPRLPRRHRSERLPARAAGRARGRGLSLLAEQPDGHRDDARAARALGRVGARDRRASSCSTPRTSRTSPIRRCRTRSTRSPARRITRSSCAASRSAPGFTGVRCAFMVVPKTVTGVDPAGKRVPLNALWSRRHTTKFNGASTSCSAVRPPPIRPRGSPRPPRRSRSTWRMRGCCAKDSARRASRCSAACTRRTSGCARPAAIGSWDFFDRLLDRGACRRHARCGLRSSRRGLLPAVRVQLTRERRGSDRADPHRVCLIRCRMRLYVLVMLLAACGETAGLPG